MRVQEPAEPLRNLPNMEKRKILSTGDPPMNYRTQLPALLIVLTILLTGCSTRMSSEVYFRDLLTRRRPDKQLVFHLPLPSTDECEEYRGRYDKVFKKSDGFKDMEFVKCVDLVTLSTTRCTFAFNQSGRGGNGRRSGVHPLSDDDEELRNVFIRVNPASLHNLDELLSDEFYQGLDLSEHPR